MAHKTSAASALERISRFNGSFLLVFALIGTVLSGCTPNRAYRDQGPNPTQDQFVRGHQENQYEPYTTDADQNHHFDFSYIEFDEKGDFWDRRQLGWTINDIKKVGENNDLVLVVYVHGWQNDASTLRGHDVSKFHCLLEHIAEADLPQHRVFGVYIAWRGKSVPGGDGWFPNNSPLDLASKAIFFVPHELSLWGRKNVATHTAGLPTTEAIFQSVEVARNWTQKSHHHARTILVGHSFGALVLEKALSQALAAKLISENGSSSGYFTAPADFVVLLNSAADSIYAKEMTDMFRRRFPSGNGGRGCEEVSAEYPLVVSITSKADWATKILFPIGTNLSNAFGLFHRYEWDNRFGEDSHNVSQRQYFTNTPSHNDLLISHVAEPIKGTPVDPVYEEKDYCEHEMLRPFEENLDHPKSGPNGEIRFTTGPSSGHEVEWQLTPRPDQQVTPYWIIEVPHEIIRDHSDIFNENAIALMARLFRIANPKDRDMSTPRCMSLQAPGQKLD